MKRMPAVAGQFYNGSPDRLARQVEQYMIHDSIKEKVMAIVSPHAGLMYSGHVAGAVYSAIKVPKTYLLLGPNHSGLGPGISMMSAGEWEIPTATFRLDSELAAKIKARVPSVSEDTQAHLYEHSLEVQLPFIAHSSGDCRILPVTFMRATIDDCAAVGRGIADAVRSVGYEVVIVASSDMSHYEQDSVARKLDRMAIEEILDLNPEGLYSVVMREKISMCGIIPATVMLYAALELGASEARLVKYATSGETSGDFERVVGYAGIIVK
ncbi:MAG TPA: AmmeMemoRadiSam system protein B [Dissulfurispiraceae bacterium]|nr:AmmeMemoRadiSam system protein B [Dissulfurispiraceae bacterium]